MNEHRFERDDPRASDRLAGSPPHPLAAPHEGLVGEPAPPMGDDPRPGNMGQAAEGPKPEDLDDAIDEALSETFPASDPPSWSAAPTVGDERPEPSRDPTRHGLGRVVDADADAPAR